MMSLSIINAKYTPNILENPITKAPLWLDMFKMRLEFIQSGSNLGLSRLKYVERLDVDFGEPIRGAVFLAIAHDLFGEGGFVVENVRWRRFDTYLAVAQATFVRFKPVEE